MRAHVIWYSLNSFVAFQREKFVIQDNRPFMLEFPAQDVLFDPTDIDPSCQSNGAHLVDCVLTHTIVCPDVRREGIFTINVTISNRLSGFCPVTVTFIATGVFNRMCCN